MVALEKSQHRVKLSDLRNLLRGLLLGLAGAFVLECHDSMAQSGSTRPVLVELFTSQGCSSCPPADAAAVRLSDEENILVLSLPVDYWDYLGWKDTLAQSAFTDRQRAYASVHGETRVYTPQMMIDGRDDEVGSRESAVRRMVDKRLDAIQRGIDGEAGLLVEHLKDGSVKAHLSSGLVGADSATLWLVHLKSRVSVDIGRGENRGRTITYANVAHRLASIATWHGGSLSVSVPMNDANEFDGLALILQANESGSVRGVGRVLSTAWVKRPGLSG